jgi:hypothetical protein
VITFEHEHEHELPGTSPGAERRGRSGGGGAPP